MIPQRSINWAESLTGRGISMTNVDINHKSQRERETSNFLPALSRTNWMCFALSGSLTI